jgi:molecular chaperone DnaK
MNIGIDLGTTYSACAYMSEDGEPHIVINSEGNRLTPSVVMEEENGDIVVGDIAKDSVVIMANHCVSTVKDFMGTERTFPMPSGKKYSPEEISAFILKKIRRDAENKLNAEVKEAVITVPAYFTDAQRKSTEDAGKIAGLKVTGMINEPTAAAISFAHTHKVKDAMIMVYDLGGGTFDVSIVSIKDKHVSV